MINITLEDLSTSVTTAVVGSVANLINYLPSFIGGLIVLLVGIIFGAVTYRVILGFLKALQIEKFLARYGVSKIEGHQIQWPEILAELIRWTIIIVFLVPALESWQLGAVNTVLSRVILYIPNVIVAVTLALIGMVFGKIAYRLTYSAGSSLGHNTAHILALVARWSLLVFVAFLVLNQLGVAQDLIRILFAGIVLMLALAGGLAFGLGGQHVAKALLETIVERFKK